MDPRTCEYTGSKLYQLHSTYRIRNQLVASWCQIQKHFQDVVIPKGQLNVFLNRGILLAYVEQTFTVLFASIHVICALKLKWNWARYVIYFQFHSRCAVYKVCKALVPELVSCRNNCLL